MKKMFLGVAFLSAFTLAKAQTVDEIVSKHTEALGGKANLDKVQSLSMEGNVEAQGQTMKLTITKVQGKLSRTDISIPAMNMNLYDLTTDKEGWMLMGQPAPVEKTGDILKASQKQMEVNDDLYNYAAKGDKIDLQGKEDVNGIDCYKLKLTNATGDSAFIYVDPTTWMINRKKAIQKFNGQEMSVTADFSDYKPVEGVKFPFTTSTEQGAMTFTTIKVNPTIDPKLYQHE